MIVVVVLKHGGSTLRLRERLKIEVTTSGSSLAHALRACTGILLRALCTWPDDAVGEGEEGWACVCKHFV